MGRLSVAAALVLALAGCANRVYRPATPLAEVGDVRLGARWLQVTPTGGKTAVEARMSVESAGTWRVLSAWLAPASAPPCTGGVRATSIVVAGRQLIPMPQSFLSPGAGELQVLLPAEAAGDASPFAMGPAALDLALAAEPEGGGERCVRARLGTGARPVEWEDRPWWFGGLHARTLWFASDLSGMRAAVGGGASAGVFAGPARLGLEVDVARASVPETPGVAGAYLTTATGAVAAPLAVPWRGRSLANALLGELGWQIGAVELDLGGGQTSKARLLHGPRAALHLALVPAAPRWRGFDGSVAPRGGGLDFFVAHWWSPGNGRSWILGVGLSGFGGF
jgi:hypothetical protein